MEYKESRINTRPKGLQHLPLGLKSLPSSQEGKTSNILKMELIASDPHLGGDGAQVENMKMCHFKSLNLNRLDMSPVKDKLMPQAIKILVIVSSLL